MEDNIKELCDFSCRHFGIKEEELYNRDKRENCVLSRYVLWYYLHYNMNVSISKLSLKFKKDKRTVFYGISKIKNGIKSHKYYRDIYNNFLDEYKKNSHT